MRRVRGGPSWCLFPSRLFLEFPVLPVVHPSGSCIDTLLFHRVRLTVTFTAKFVTGVITKVKPDIHPKYVPATVHCACGETWQTRSTKSEIRLEICSNCHPFFTGKQKLIDTAGRVERFNRKYGRKTTEA